MVLSRECKLLSYHRLHAGGGRDFLPSFSPYRFRFSLEL